FLKAMEFTAFTRRIATLLEADPDAFEADPELRSKGVVVDGPSGTTSAQTASTHMTDHGPEAHAEAVLEAIRAIPCKHEDYEIVRDADQLAGWVANIIETGHVAIDTETTGLDNQPADLVRVCLAPAPGKACYIPLGHVTGAGDLLGGGRAEGQMDLRLAIDMLKPIFEDPAILKIGQNLKYDMGILSRYGITLAPIDDTLLMSYALDGARNTGMAAPPELDRS